jgi:uncharacterized protein YdhG (YjbR/CyaY superfamily)
LTYLPHSGSVNPELKDELVGFNTSKGALQFPVDVPLPMSLVERLIRIGITQAWRDEDGFTAGSQLFRPGGVREEE